MLSPADTEVVPSDTVALFEVANTTLPMFVPFLKMVNDTEAAEAVRLLPVLFVALRVIAYGARDPPIYSEFAGFPEQKTSNAFVFGPVGPVVP
jgi:hypothetical protein